VTSARVYLPLELAALTRLARGETLDPPVIVWTVTPGLRGALPGADLDELEYAALVAAAAAAGVARGTRPVRRVVAAADVPVAALGGPAPGGGTADPAAVSLRAALQLRQIVSFQVDEHPGGVDDVDLMWWDATELTQVIALAR